MISSLDTLKRTILSLFILAILGLQVMPIITKIMHRPWGGWYFPFIDYPMYLGSHQEGEHVQVGNFLTATTSSGEELNFAYNDRGLGLNFFKFQNLVTKLLRPDGHLYVSEFTALHPRGYEFVRLDIYNYPVIVTREGPKEADAELLASIVIGSGTKEEVN